MRVCRGRTGGAVGHVLIHHGLRPCEKSQQTNTKEKTVSHDMTALAEAVGVYTPDNEQAAIERLHRVADILTATTFGIVVGTGLIWTNMAGLW